LCFLILRQYLILTLLFFSIILGVSFTQPAKAIAQTLGGTWSVNAGMPTPREGLGAGAVGSKLYAIKGYNFGDTSINQAYDPATNTWTMLANSPVPESEFGATAVGTRVYAIGGRTNGGTTVSIYDTASNTWSFGSSMPTARRGAAAVAVGNTIYAIGGSACCEPGASPQYTANEAYDTLSNTWRILAPLPSPRSDAYAVAVSGKIYVVGGFSSTLSNSTSSFLSTTQAYDIASNTWSTLAPMPTARDHVVAGVCGNDIFVVGGATNPFFTATSVVEAYQIGNNQWVTGIAPMPTPRWEMAAAQIGNTLYVVGGGGFGLLDTNPDGTGPNQALTMVCPPAVTPSLSVSPLVSMGAKGSAFTVNLNVANVTNLFSVNVFLTFDPTLLTAGPLVDSGSVLRSYCSATPGCSGVTVQSTSGPGFVGETLSIVSTGNGTSIQGFSGSGLVYSVTLIAAKTVTGTSTIHIASDSQGNNNGNLVTSQSELIPHFSVDGVFTDDGPAIFVSPVPNRFTIETPGMDASNITVYSLNGFTGTVSLSLSGVPASVNASLAQSTLLLAGASATTRLRVSVGPSASSGNFTITVTGTAAVKSKTIINSSSLLLNIPAPTPDFLVSVAPSQITIPNGGSGSASVTITSVHGFKSPVSLTLQGLAFSMGITSAFTVNPVTPSAGGNASSTLKLFVAEGQTPTIINLIIMATGGGFTHAVTFTLSVSAFFINVFPQFLTLTPGETTFSSVQVSGVNNFIGTVNLSTVGVPSGVSANVFPSTATLVGGNQSAFSTLTIQAGANAKPGNSVIFVIGNSTTSFAVAAVGLQITDYSVALGKPDVTVPVTGSVASTVFLSSLNGFTGPIAISVSGVPAGVSVTATPISFFLGPGSIASVTLNIATSAAAVAGNYELTITAASGPLTHTATLMLHVTDFSATGSPQTVSMSRRQTVNVTISIASLNGFSQPVTLSGTILGNTTGVMVTITPSTVAPAGGVVTATLTISTGLKPTLGTFTVLVTASSGSLVHLVPITLTITK